MTRARPVAFAVSLVASFVAAAGCSTRPRIIVATGTTLGIKATPGDGQVRPPQVVVGYKRAEAALIPVEGGGAKAKDGSEASGKPIVMQQDVASTVASFYLKSEWTAGTEIRSFIGTGVAAQHIVDQKLDQAGGSFGEAFEKAARKRLDSPRP